MKIHKKTWPKMFKAMACGAKNFDARVADFKCKPGDTIIFEEWDPKTKKCTGRSLEKRITYVLKTKSVNFWPEKDIQKFGLVIIAFK
jgi:ribosomal protein S17